MLKMLECTNAHIDIYTKRFNRDTLQSQNVLLQELNRYSSVAERSILLQELNRYSSVAERSTPRAQ